MPRQPRTSANKGKRSVADVTTIPYVKGFKPPTKNKAVEAIGFRGHTVPSAFSPADDDKDDFTFFKSIPAPTSLDDWLAQYNEEGQTYQEFLKDCPWLTSRKRKYMSQTFLSSGQTIKQKYPEGKIYIVQVGKFSEEASALFSRLMYYTSIFLDLPVATLPALHIESDEGRVFWVKEPEGQSPSAKKRRSTRTKQCQLNSRFNTVTKHLQVCVDSNLLQLKQAIPDDAICMIGLTMMDLYVEDSDLFVAGMAEGNQRVAVFSLYRYDPCFSFSKEFWYQMKKTKPMSDKERQKIILKRGCKLLVHEIGHLLGIGHCIFFDCCMNGSGHLEEDFRQPMHLCPMDLHKLHTLVGFDINARYKALLKFYKKEGFKEESEWMERRLKCLSD